MSRTNAEAILEITERWNAGDRTHIAEYCDRAVELESPLSSVSGELYRGHAGMEQWMRDLDEQFSEWQVRLDDVREVGTRVIAVGSVHARGRNSGVEFDLPSALVAEFGTDHRITRARIYADVNAAREAVGLME
jgi:ketosteroid isomerase-like protein